MTARRLSLAELRTLVLEALVGADWTTVGPLRRRLGLRPFQETRLALVLERLVVDGDLEFRRGPAGSREFRRRSS